MAKSLFLLIISGVMSAILNPVILTASDKVALTGLNPVGVVETVPLPEPEPEVATEVVMPAAPVAGAIDAEYVSPLRNYNVTISSGEVIASGLNYEDIYKTGKMVYGHNIWGLMGNIVALGYGEQFTVTEGGETKTYQVADIVIYEKNTERGTLERDGQGSYMRSVLNAVDKDTGVYYDLSLLTCYGEAYGNGDASHRYVVFANMI